MTANEQGSAVDHIVQERLDTGAGSKAPSNIAQYQLNTIQQAVQALLCMCKKMEQQLHQHETHVE